MAFSIVVSHLRLRHVRIRLSTARKTYNYVTRNDPPTTLQQLAFASSVTFTSSFPQSYPAQ
ncbi:hypothetical protein I305_02703 [Cryptococcus gattii E566]|uniref:Uncharacterized protein n=2 Tax=Cryptococcus gattii TaxID=37769 RepID=E6R6C2_CRYGW|nr:Hypothetical Protein CGB_E0200W [Cryptococcus gattii WM276]ADV22262.1 Hypothetical Protein CGB_E0200W [Cryptococcus gattii WM276]KIR78690.1 hypothetical protein I306_04259 [Cryptococcus gattii EJB2]KIY34516.1 hypothetical protein I305_02703 [Cryptococcus gattii E566]KJE04794.1 hypothetical protein I311_01241 [Cryptococcus gattii NT-10]